MKRKNDTGMVSFTCAGFQLPPPPNTLLHAIYIYEIVIFPIDDFQRKKISNFTGRDY